jgi:hypothetical protein
LCFRKTALPEDAASVDDVPDSSYLNITSDNEDEMLELHASTARKRLQWIQQKCPSVEEVFVKYPRYLDRPKKAVSNKNCFSLIDSFPNAFAFIIPIDSD